MKHILYLILYYPVPHHRSADYIDLHPVFQLLKSYLMWKQNKDDLMRYFSTEFHNLVQIEQSEDDLDIMKISNPNPTQ